MTQNSSEFRPPQRMLKYARLALSIALFLSLASIYIAIDFGYAFAGRLYWSYGSPVITQSIAVAVGIFSAWAVYYFRSPGGQWAQPLYWIGMVVLWLPLTHTFGYPINGGHRWIGLGSEVFHFPADSVGLLLILPQWVRWAENKVHGGLLFSRFRKWITPSVAFTFTLIAVNILLLWQRSYFGVYLANSIGAMLWFLGRLDRRWKMGSGVVFATVLLLIFFGGWQGLYSRTSSRPFPKNFVVIPSVTRFFHTKASESPLWEMASLKKAAYPQPTKTFRPRPSEFCEHVSDIVRLRFGLQGVIVTALALAGMGVSLLRLVRSPESLQPSLYKAALAAYLFFPMAGSLIRTFGDTWLLPAIPFPFLGYGFTVTTTAWLALGLLLRADRSEFPPVKESITL